MGEGTSDLCPPQKNPLTSRHYQRCYDQELVGILTQYSTLSPPPPLTSLDTQLYDIATLHLICPIRLRSFCRSR